MSTSFQLFNLETMSGVFPGTRTMVFQRVRVRPLEQGALEQGALLAGDTQWVRLLWYEEPPACVVECGANLLRIPEPLNRNFGSRLAEALAASGLQYMACGDCAFWQATAVKTGDGLPAGRCTWRPQGEGEAAAYGGDAGAPHDAGRAVAVGAGLQPLGTGGQHGGAATDTGRTNAGRRARGSCTHRPAR